MNIANQIIFYGAGDYARRNLHMWVSNGLVPVCFADIDPNKHYTDLVSAEDESLKYEILPLDKAIGRHEEYEIYVTLAHENLLGATKWLIDNGIPRKKIKYADPFEYRKGCNMLGRYIQFRANFFYGCCSQMYREKITRQATAGEDIQRHKEYCEDLVERLRTGQRTGCDNCPELREDIWEVNPKLWCIQLATGFSDARCNLNCDFCADKDYLVNRNEHNQHSVIETFRGLIECKLENVEIELAAGEISVSPYRDSVINLIRETGTPVQIFTNAALHNQDIADLMQQGLVSLVVSIDAGTKETYKRLKGVDAFEKVKENLGMYASTGGQIEVKYIILDGINDNVTDIDGFAELAAGLRATVVISADSTVTNNRLSENTMKMLLRLIQRIRKEGLMIYPFLENFNPCDLDEIHLAIQTGFGECCSDG